LLPSGIKQFLSTVGADKTVETTGNNLVNSFGYQSAQLQKVSEASAAAGTWALQGNIPSVSDSSYSAAVQASVEIDGESLSVVRFTRPAANFGANVGIYYRFNIGTIPAEGQYYYVKTYLRINSGALASTANEADFRVSIYPAVNSTLGDAAVRSRLDLTAAANLPTAVWKKYEFVVFIPASLANNFFEVRLALPNVFASPLAVTMDMASVDVFKADLVN
jgi:hypothetical protein